MSLNTFAIAESAIAEQVRAATTRTPPSARVIVAKADAQATAQLC
jgi:hypothetical protein